MIWRCTDLSSATTSSRRVVANNGRCSRRSAAAAAGPELDTGRNRRRNAFTMKNPSKHIGNLLKPDPDEKYFSKRLKGKGKVVHEIKSLACTDWSLRSRCIKRLFNWRTATLTGSWWEAWWVTNRPRPRLACWRQPAFLRRHSQLSSFSLQ